MEKVSFSKFSITELFANSCGKTSLALVCAFVLILTGSWMGLAGGYYKQADVMSNGLLFATLGTGLLGIRRFTPDKNISPDAQTDDTK